MKYSQVRKAFQVAGSIYTGIRIISLPSYSQDFQSATTGKDVGDFPSIPVGYLASMGSAPLSQLM